MEITWIGHACFQLRGKNVTLITDPFTPQPASLPQEAGQQQAARAMPLRLGKLNASIVTISHNDSGHNNAAAIGGNPRVVYRPGEYEISDVLITGIASYHDDKRGQDHGRNTIYVIHMDDLVLCHLGDLGHTLQEEQLEEVADVDILLIPISGQHTIQATQAAEIISRIEPRVVIPMHYSVNAGVVGREGSEPLSKFCREMGVESVQAQPKLSVTRSSIPAEMQVVLLTPRGQS